MDKIAMNKFEKEYITGRKDQFDIDYAVFRKAVEETETREDLIKQLEERFNYVIAHIASERAKELIAEMDLS
jgi:hypothetical protein